MSQSDVTCLRIPFCSALENVMCSVECLPLFVCVYMRVCARF